MIQSPAYDSCAQRGRLICDKGTEVSRLDDNEYAVRSQSGKEEYHKTDYGESQAQSL